MVSPGWRWLAFRRGRQDRSGLPDRQTSLRRPVYCPTFGFSGSPAFRFTTSASETFSAPGMTCCSPVVVLSAFVPDGLGCCAVYFSCRTAEVARRTKVRVPHMPNQRARRTALKFSLSPRNPTEGS